MLRWLKGLFGSSATRPAETAPPARAEDADAPPPPFLRREPMLDRNQQLVAYVFSVQTPGAMRGHAWRAASRKFFDGALIDHFAAGDLAGLLAKRLAFLPLGPGGLDHPRLERLPRQNLVIEFAPATDTRFDQDGERDAILTRLSALRDAGFQLACGDDLAGRGLPEALDLAHYISLGEVAEEAPPDLLARCRRLATSHPDAVLIARAIDSGELYQACRQLSIQLFQGRFLTHRELNPANKIAPYRMFVVQLLNAIKRQADYDELAGIAWCDPALAYRLLRFVNSAAFGLRVKIDRLRNAMAYVGRDELYRWLTLLLFSSKDNNPLDEALRENALTRARLSEKLAEGRLSAKECDEVFVVGILSVIDTLLEMPMPDALAQITLPDAVADALLRRDGKYAPYLSLAIACEESDQDTIRALAIELGMDADTVNRRHIEALAWTMNFSESLADDPSDS